MLVFFSFLLFLSNEWLRLNFEFIYFHIIYNQTNIFSLDYEGKERKKEREKKKEDFN